MFALGIRYLMGWAMAAADGAAKLRAEWPPHPDRVFMALAAAHFETDEDPRERRALEWLEGLPAPGIVASGAEYRDAVTVYVPVNDNGAERPIEWNEKNKKWTFHQISGAMPLGRKRRPRGFPVAIPHDPTVFLVWNDTAGPGEQEALERLCSKVTHVGHPASLVQMWLEDAPPEPQWVTVESVAAQRMRVFSPGRLSILEQCLNFNAVCEFRDREGEIKRVQGAAKATGLPREDKKAANERVALLRREQEQRFPGGEPTSRRPETALPIGYGRPAIPHSVSACGSVFDARLIVLKLSGHRLGLPATLKLTEALRNAALSCCPSPVPEWVSGHKPDGAPSGGPHLAILPLPFVGRTHADGRIQGLALAVPKEVSPEEANHCLGPLLSNEHGLPRRVRLFDGRSFACEVELDTGESPPWSLRNEHWVGPARRFSSVTPVVFDRHFEGHNKWNLAAEMIKDACERIGLPRPVDVLLHPVSPLEGVPRSNEFPYMSRKSNGGKLHQAHAILTFETEVLGPVVIGAGRFRGYGLCRPVQ